MSIEKVAQCLGIKEEDIRDYCGSVRDLLTLKKENPDYFKQWENKELFDELVKFGEQNRTELPDKVDMIVVTSGQLVTMALNYMSMKSLGRRLDFSIEGDGHLVLLLLRHPPTYVVNMMPTFPTEEQIKLTEEFLGKDLHQKWKYSDALYGNGHFHRLSFMNTDGIISHVLDALSYDFHDSPQNVVIVTPNPEQCEKAFNERREITSCGHHFYFYRDLDTDCEEYKRKYFNESMGEYNRFALRDLAERQFS